jgi:D-3-phosphoglycerate dehydrogenase
MKIVISDSDHANIDQEISTIKAAGLEEPVWLKCKTEDDVIRECKGATSIINQYVPITRRVFQALVPALKHVAHYGVGVNNVDLAAATEFGVQVCNVPDYGMHEVSDHTLALMMALARKLVFMATETKAGQWNYQHAIPLCRLYGQTVGTIGMGRNARLFARKAAALGCRILGFDPYYKPASGEDPGIIQVSLDELIRESDFVVINCPLTEETRNMVSDAEFRKMKPTAYIINVSRGGIIDEAALARALQNRDIGGAALDVTDKEPLEGDSPLRKFDNCIITPHMAWYSEQSAQELKRKTAEEAVRFVTGQPVRYPVNKLV